MVDMANVADGNRASTSQIHPNSVESLMGSLISPAPATPLQTQFTSWPQMGWPHSNGQMHYGFNVPVADSPLNNNAWNLNAQIDYVEPENGTQNIYPPGEGGGLGHLDLYSDQNLTVPGLSQALSNQPYQVADEQKKTDPPTPLATSSRLQNFSTELPKKNNEARAAELRAKLLANKSARESSRQPSPAGKPSERTLTKENNHPTTVSDKDFANLFAHQGLGSPSNAVSTGAAQKNGLSSPVLSEPGEIFSNPPSRTKTPNVEKKATETQSRDTRPKRIEPKPAVNQSKDFPVGIDARPKSKKIPSKTKFPPSNIPQHLKSSPVERLQDDNDIAQWLEATNYYDLEYRRRKLALHRKKKAHERQREEIEREECELQGISYVARAASASSLTTSQQTIRHTSASDPMMPPPPPGSKDTDTEIAKFDPQNRSTIPQKRLNSTSDTENKTVEKAPRLDTSRTNGEAKLPNPAKEQPKSLEHRISRPPHDRAYRERSRTPYISPERHVSPPSSNNQSHNRAPTCYGCGQPGHTRRQCRNNEAQSYRPGRDNAAGDRDRDRPTGYQQWVPSNYGERNPRPHLRSGGEGRGERYEELVYDEVGSKENEGRVNGQGRGR